jgi:hypothetical protein
VLEVERLMESYFGFYVDNRWKTEEFFVDRDYYALQDGNGGGAGNSRWLFSGNGEGTPHGVYDQKSRYTDLWGDQDGYSEYYDDDKHFYVRYSLNMMRWR